MGDYEAFDAKIQHMYLSQLNIINYHLKLKF